MEVDIPFMPEFKDRLLSGRKTVTSRTKPMGKEGDHFERFGATFKIMQVFKATLNQVCILGYHPEGFNKPEEFVEIWDRIHPNKGYCPEQEIWVHYFRKL